MFILRRLTGETEINEFLGESYNLVREEQNQSEFKRTLEIYFDGLVKNDDDIYGFIIYKSGGKIMPLYKGSTYFIMCSNGKTFANVSENLYR